MSGKGNGPENHTFNKLQKSNPCCIKHWADLSETLHLPAPTTACFFHMYAIRSWFFVRFVTTHTETKTKWQRHSAVRKVKWKAKLLKHSNSHPDAVHNNAHPALGSQTRVETSAARPCLRFISASTNSGWKDRTASQRWRYCLRRTSSSDSLSSNHVLLLCKTILKHFLKGFLEGKSLAPKWRKSADKSLSQPSCSHSNTIYEVQLQKTIVLRMQPQHEATLTQPLQCDLQRLSCKTQ